MYLTFVILIVIVQSSCGSDIEFWDDGNLNEAISSEQTLGVFLYSHKDAGDLKLESAVKSIQLTKSDLQSHGVDLVFLDCDNSKIVHCKKPERLYHMVFVKNSDVATYVHMENLQTLLDVQIHAKSNLLLNNIKEVKDYDELKEIEEMHVAKSDFMLFYIPALGTIEHLRMINSAIIVPKSVSIYYTFNHNIDDDKFNEVRYMSCLVPEDNACKITYASKNNNDDNFKNFIARKSRLVILQENEDMVLTLTNMVNKGNDVLLLISGQRKFKSALTLANEVVDQMGGGIHALVIDGLKFVHLDLKSRVENDKIFAIASPGTSGLPKYLNIGFLVSEQPKDLIEEFSYAMSKQDEVYTTPSGTADEVLDLDIMDVDPESVQDDPIAYSVHHNRHVKDLYYFDYNTIPRLTDKSYEKVTQSSEYSVILFTLEFNPKALAALVNFVEIHNAFKKESKSPMYRVECYNWPDICEKEKVFTSPRMFFYPTESTVPIEYTGMWDKVSMKNAIIRYSSPSVIVVRKKEDILPYLPIKIRSVIGLFENDEGTSEFRKAAVTLRKDYQFIEVHGDVAKFIAGQYEVDYEHKRLLAFEHSFPKHKYGTFTAEKDILDYCAEAFAVPELQELGIYSFVEILKDSKPLFIYFWDRQDGNEIVYYTALKDTIQDIASNKILSDNVIFTWMDASMGSTGEFVLARYNYRSRKNKPIVAFFDKKGSVILRSCYIAEQCTNTSLISWIEDCITGKENATYELSTEDWKPRLDGYDFLQFMKEEGTYPENRITFGSSDDSDEESKPSSRGGRTIIDMRHKQKKEDMTGGKEKSQQHEIRENKDAKTRPAHSEL